MPENPDPATAAQQTPAPCTITPALLKTHSITDDEYASIESKLGRVPSLTELGIFSVMWSEHCSYKSSRVHLKRLPTRGTRTSGPGSVIQGPGENAGIIDVGDGWACAFKIESHNHPSYIEPYQGAATGVGGILRDIFTMGARPMAVMDSLRFGPLGPAQKTRVSGARHGDPLVSTEDRGAPHLDSQMWDTNAQGRTDFARNRHTMTGVVHGVAGYGNCFGVPNLGGETRFEECYSGNPLLNAFALGLVRTDEIFYAKAEGVGNPVFYVGAKTGRDGIHGATMASEEFTEGSEQKRPNVQMGDPFLEKLLLEACLEVMKTGAVLGIQDMGAAGLTCSTCEMGARGNLGVTIELDRVPQRETGMTTYEIMLSESQERMLLVAAKGREAEVLAVFEKWGLDCAEVGVVTADDVMRVYHAGVLEAEIPNKALTDEAPVYNRPVGVWNAPVPQDAPAWVLAEFQKPRDYTADLLKLLASPNICSKRWIYEQYDSMVQTNTVQGPGGEAGVIRIKGTGKTHVSEARHGAPQSFASGPTPKAAHDPSLLDRITSFIAGSTPEAEATALTGNLDAANPVVLPGAEHEAGLVADSSVSDSFESSVRAERGLAMALAGNGRWCYLDPKLGAMHAVAEAARKVACTGAVPVAATNCLNFGNPQKPEIMAQLSEAIEGIAEACNALATPVTGGNVSLYNETLGEGIYPTPVIGVVGILNDVTRAVPSAFQAIGEVVLLIGGTGGQIDGVTQLGSSQYAQAMFGELWGAPPKLDLTVEAPLHKALQAMAAGGLISSASDVSDGGIAVALAKAAMVNGIGVKASCERHADDPVACSLFSESGSRVIVTCKPESLAEILEIVSELGNAGLMYELGETVADSFYLDNGQMLEGAVPDALDAEIDCSVEDLRRAYLGALEAQLADEVAA